MAGGAGTGAGVNSGAAAPLGALAAGLAGSFGMYSGPGWPQALNRAQVNMEMPI